MVHNSMPNVLRGQFLTKPYPSDTRSIQERTRDQVQMTTDISFAKSYAVFFASFILLTYLVAYIKQDTRSELDILKSEICSAVPASALCKNPTVLPLVDSIATKHGVPTRLIVWIYNAESTLWTHFNKPACAGYRNWAGLKWRKFHDNSVQYYQENRRKPDSNWCWLYKFDSFEQATESLALTLSRGYSSCLKDKWTASEQTKCISYAYVWDPNKAEQSWISRVSRFYSS